MKIEDAWLPEKLKSFIKFKLHNFRCRFLDHVKDPMNLVATGIIVRLSSLPTIASLNFIFPSSAFVIQVFGNVVVFSWMNGEFFYRTFRFAQSSLAAKLVYSRLKSLKVLYWSLAFVWEKTEEWNWILCAEKMQTNKNSKFEINASAAKIVFVFVSFDLFSFCGMRWEWNSAWRLCCYQQVFLQILLSSNGSV